MSRRPAVSAVTTTSATTAASAPAAKTPLTAWTEASEAEDGALHRALHIVAVGRDLEDLGVEYDAEEYDAAVDALVAGLGGTLAARDRALAEVQRLREQATIVVDVRRVLHGAREDDVVPLVAGLTAGVASQHAALTRLWPSLARLVGQAELVLEILPDPAAELRGAIADARAVLERDRVEPAHADDDSSRRAGGSAMSRATSAGGYPVLGVAGARPAAGAAPAPASRRASG